MASVASPVERGVPPIRAGKGHSFFLRRLHSLSGIIPVGAFLLEHFISNAFATNGPKAYADQVKFLTGLPFVLVSRDRWDLYPAALSLPVRLLHLVSRRIECKRLSLGGEFHVCAQRWTGAIAFVYIVWHTYTMRFTGIHLLTNSAPPFTKCRWSCSIGGPEFFI